MFEVGWLGYSQVSLFWMLASLHFIIEIRFHKKTHTTIMWTRNFSNMFTWNSLKSNQTVPGSNFLPRIFVCKKRERIHSWNPKQLFINGSFNWMFPNLCMGNGCFTIAIHFWLVLWSSRLKSRMDSLGKKMMTWRLSSRGNSPLRSHGWHLWLWLQALRVFLCH